MGNPTPNPYYWRSSSGIFFDLVENKIYDLWTPFGGIPLRRTLMDKKEWEEISENFITIMSQEGDLEKVTVNLHDFAWEGCDFLCLKFFRKLKIKKNSTKLELYQIKQIGDINLQSENPSLLFDEPIMLVEGQYERDRTIFCKLSDGKNCFVSYKEETRLTEGK